MTRKSRFIGNTTALAVSAVLTAVLTLIQVKILAAFLSRESFGLFAALRGLSLFVAMVAANGLPHVLVRFLPEHETRAELRRALTLSMWTLGVASVALVAVCFGVVRFEDWLFRSVPALQRTNALQVWFLLTIIGISLKVVLYAGLNGLRRLGSQTVIEVSALVVQVLWMYLVRDSLSLEVLFRIIAIVTIGTVAITLPWYFVRLVRDMDRRVPLDTSNTVRGSDYGRYWVGASGLGFVALAFSDIDRYFLTGVLALEMLSLFHVASRVVRVVNRFLAVPVLAFQPEVTRLDAEGRADDVARAARIFFKFSVSVSVFLAAGISVYASDVIRIIASRDYLDAVPVLIVLTASLPLTAMTAPLTSIMKARDHIARAFYCDLGWAVTYIVLLFVLGRAFGLLGAGVALVAACAVQLSLALGLGALAPGIGGIGPVLARALTAAALALAPAAAVGAIWPSSGAAFAMARVACLPLAVVVFRWVIRRSGMFSPDENSQLVAMLSSSGPGRLFARVVL